MKPSQINHGESKSFKNYLLPCILNNPSSRFLKNNLCQKVHLIVLSALTSTPEMRVIYLLLFHFAHAFLLDLWCLVRQPQSCVTVLNEHDCVTILDVRLPHPLIFWCFWLLLLVLNSTTIFYEKKLVYTVSIIRWYLKISSNDTQDRVISISKHIPWSAGGKRWPLFLLLCSCAQSPPVCHVSPLGTAPRSHGEGDTAVPTE